MFFCAFIWSMCTTLAGLSSTLGELVFWRSCVGIGTGAFNVIAPVLIADYFPIVERNFAYGLLALSIPVGAALGFGAGAIIGSAYNWRIAFYALGIPSVILSFTVFLCNDPVRGVNDADVMFDSDNNEKQIDPDTGDLAEEANDLRNVTPKLAATLSVPPSLDVVDLNGNRDEDLQEGGGDDSTTWRQEMDNVIEIMTCPPFLYAIAGLTGANFALSALADW